MSNLQFSSCCVNSYYVGRKRVEKCNKVTAFNGHVGLLPHVHRVLAITTAVFIMEVLSKLLVQLNFIKNSTPWYLLRLQLYFNMVFLRISLRYSVFLCTLVLLEMNFTVAAINFIFSLKYFLFVCENSFHSILFISSSKLNCIVLYPKASWLQLY